MEFLKIVKPNNIHYSLHHANNWFHKAMFDLGAYINGMPLSVFISLSFGTLKTKGIKIRVGK